MQMRCERRGQLEIGVIDHEGRIFAAFGASVQGHNVTAYTALHEGRIGPDDVGRQGRCSPAARRSCGRTGTARWP